MRIRRSRERFSTRFIAVAVTAAVAAAGLVAVPSAQSGGSHPHVFLNQSEIDAIAAKIAAGQEPWKTAFSRLKAEADAALSLAPLSVTYSGSSSHDYYTMKPYSWSNNMPSPCGSTHCDGQINPEADRADYEAATKVSDATRALGVAYAMTGDAKYANKAIQLIRVWALDSATYMSPKVFVSQGIEQFAVFPAFFYGADLIWNYSGWNATDKQRFATWARTFASDATDLSYSNNWDAWRLLCIATAGSLADDSGLLSHAFNTFKSVLASHIDSDGKMEREIGRTLSLDYSMFSLNPFTQIAEVARHHGVDLYNYSSSGRSLALAWDFHAPYLLNPSSWPYEQIKAYNQDGVALYEIAYTRLRKTAYLNVINKYGRPLQDSWAIGPTTLTHSLSGSAPSPPGAPGAPGSPANVRIVR
jgi:hypothetical protein